MLNDEICKLRDKLNESIVTGKDYSVIYQLSVELDELIAKYYRGNKKAISWHNMSNMIESRKHNLKEGYFYGN